MYLTVSGKRCAINKTRFIVEKQIWISKLNFQEFSGWERKLFSSKVGFEKKKYLNEVSISIENKAQATVACPCVFLTCHGVIHNVLKPASRIISFRQCTAIDVVFFSCCRS